MSHKIELKPNDKQKTYFKKACGVFRFVWNWALMTWNLQYEAYREAKLKDPDITVKPPNALSLKKLFNNTIKKEPKFEWLYEVTKYASQQPFINLQKSWDRFFKKSSNRPRFKSKSRGKDSFYIGGDQIKVKANQIWIPLLGWVRMRECLRFEGKINSVTISRQADRWYVSIQVEITNISNSLKSKKVISNGSENQAPVGVDLGLNTAVQLSNGISIKAPKPLSEYLRRMARYQRKFSKMTKGSKNRAKLRMKISRLHKRISNMREDFLHKTTSYLVYNYSSVGIEDLNVKGMVKNRKLSRAISDVGFGEFRRQLSYKSSMCEIPLKVFDRFFPSSKSCNCCKNIKSDLSLSDRTYICDVCGNKIDRDLNASINLEPVPRVHREFTPVEITALERQTSLVFATSIELKRSRKLTSNEYRLDRFE